MSDARHRTAVAERAARAGGVVAREEFRADLAVETKRDKNDLVTRADREAQGEAIATVAREFPGEAMVCEEGEAGLPPGDDIGADLVETVPETGPAWIVDPIDGTSNFVRGVRTWATAVAAVVDGEPVGAATYMPSTGDLYAAGETTATLDDEPTAVSSRTDPERFTVAAVGWWPPERRAEMGRLCGEIGRRFAELRRIGSFQTTLAYVASGGLDAAVATGRNHPWDTVGGVHCVRRAGGAVTDLDGDRWRHDSEGLVASNGADHDAVLAAARAAVEG